MTHTTYKLFRKRTIVHLAEGYLSPRTAKTSRGVLMYSPHDNVGIIDSVEAGKKCHQVLGVGGDIPIRSSLAEFVRDDPKPDTMVIGVTPVGGSLPTDFRRHVLDALEAGIDVWSGMHQFLIDDKEFRVAAEKGGAEIWDVRKPPEDLPVGFGHMINNKSYCCLMVGTDCALGKMTAGLEIQKAAIDGGLKAEFVATGQTGMMITGWGHPIDAIPGDFMTGCVEKDCLSVDGECDLILVEGQGSLFHPGYSPVTLGLMHGALPDGMILCHQPSRTTISNRDHVPVPPLKECVDVYLRMQENLKPTRVIGVCMNTFGMEEAAAKAAIDAAADELGVPATDPVRFGCEELIAALRAEKERTGK